MAPEKSGQMCYNQPMPPTIDIHQLPIPMWDLRCPDCHYDLTGLPSHRCPECGLSFDIADVVQSWHRLRAPTFTGREQPVPDFGLECAKCDEPLVGSMGSVCGHCAAPLDLEKVRPTRKWFTLDRMIRRGVPMDLIEALLVEEQVPYRIEKDQTAGEIFGFTTMDQVRIRVLSEFFFDFLHLVRIREEEQQSDVERAAQDRWTCAECDEKNPGHFDLCWSCSEDRPDQPEE